MNKITRVIVSGLFVFFVALSAFADIERVSVSSAGIQGDGSSSYSSISADGRFVVFSSRANNLVSNDIYPSNQDLFLHDRLNGATELVSVSSTGEQGRGIAASPSISADGRFIAFASLASNLVENDTNGDVYNNRGLDVFVHDRETGMTERVSVSSTGEQGDHRSFSPSISADGRFVSFASTASNLVAGDTNGRDDVFVHDRETEMTDRVSVSSTGKQAVSDSDSPSISSDGRVVAFRSYARLLTPDKLDFGYDIFVHDRETGKTERMSVSSTGVGGNAFSAAASISGDGRFVTFESLASNLVDGDNNVDLDNNNYVNNTGHDVFVRDRITGITKRVSVSSTGIGGIGSSTTPSISDDGRFVTFQSKAENLVQGDTNGRNDIFIHNLETGVTERVSTSASGAQGNDDSNFSNSVSTPSISADGHDVAFASSFYNLVPGDTNNTYDVFVTDNPLANSINNLITIETRLNGKIRASLGDVAQLLTGSLYEVTYTVTNHSPVRLTGVQIFEDGNLVCNVYTLEPGQTKQRARCTAERVVLSGDHYIQSIVRGGVSGAPTYLTNDTDAYYTGNDNASGGLRLTHRINNINADLEDQAPTLSNSTASVSFKIENTGNIELYRVRTYHDPASPVNSGWEFKCLIGTLKPGQIRYCKRDMTLSESGLNKALGWAQGKRSFVSPTGAINASNPTYFIVP